MNNKNNDLLPHWLIVGLMLLTLIASVFMCRHLGDQLRSPLPDSERIVIRSVFYLLAIIGFPITNLIRHIQLRLNQTMPGTASPKRRYFLTVMVSMLIIESIGFFGVVMFILGDDFNTLYIFTGLAVLGLYLYRPKQNEYDSIIDAFGEK